MPQEYEEFEDESAGDDELSDAARQALDDMESESTFEPEPGLDEEQADNPADARDREEMALRILRQAHEALGHAVRLLEGGKSADAARIVADLVNAKRDAGRSLHGGDGARIVEGVFDGCGMIAENGKCYAVPPNYASKSRLVEGDVLKLHIHADGRFVYKQIGPVERDRVVGTLAIDDSDACHVGICEGRAYKLLPASVSYFKGEPGDEVVMLLPRHGDCAWAAVENIVRS